MKERVEVGVGVDVGVGVGAGVGDSVGIGSGNGADDPRNNGQRARKARKATAKQRQRGRVESESSHGVKRSMQRAIHAMQSDGKRCPKTGDRRDPFRPISSRPNALASETTSQKGTSAGQEASRRRSSGRGEGGWLFVCCEPIDWVVVDGFGGWLGES